jgi:hypothetical protein
VPEHIVVYCLRSQTQQTAQYPSFKLIFHRLEIKSPALPSSKSRLQL